LWHFKQNKLTWIAAALIWFIFFLTVGFIPVAGGIIANILPPVIMGGLVIGANEQQQGGDFRIAHLFAGFSNHTGQLFLIGVIYLLASLLIAGLAMPFSSMYMVMTGILDVNIDPEAFRRLIEPGMLIVTLLFAIFMTLLFMAYWYAPVLVSLEGMSALSAMTLSFRACLTNWRALSIYGLLALILIIVALIPMGLGMLIILPIIFASNYASYRDVFQKA